MPSITSKSKFWPYVEAESLLKRHPEPGKVFRLQTGYGASGLPHIGTFGEAAKTAFISTALRDLGAECTQITFSDDLDGMRKLPDTLPKEWRKYLGLPISSIPDPWEKFPNLAEHVNHLARKLIDSLEIPYEFLSSTQEYRKGTFNSQITTALRNAQAIQDIILPTLGQAEGADGAVREMWFPFLPICQNCGCINTSRVLSTDPAKVEVTYICDQVHGQATPCGHQGTMSALNGSGKFPWKVDWAARWHALEIDYELYGKDLIESAKLSKLILSRVFGGTAPLGLFYELFLDENGEKISKSKGNGISVDQWLAYASQESLVYLMLRKPTQAKKLHTGTIFQYEAEHNRLVEEYYGEYASRSAEERRGDLREYEFIHFGKPPSKAPLTVDMETFVSLIGALGTADEEILYPYARKSGLIPEGTAREQFHPFLVRAERYFEDWIKPALQPLDRKITENERNALEEFIQFLSVSSYGDLDDLEKVYTWESWLQMQPHVKTTGFKIKSKRLEWTPITIHNALYEIPRKHNLEPKDFFALNYRILLHQEKGPRLASFIKMLGQERVADALKEFLKGTNGNIE